MKKLLKFAVCLAILLMVAVLFTGCADKATGGGWFYDCRTEDKCTFGFNAQEKDNPGAEENEKVYTGQFQFQEHKKGGAKIHIDEMMYFEDFFGVVWFWGTDKEENGVLVAVTDGGEPGPGAGDSIAIWYDIPDFDHSDPGPDWLPDWAGVIDGGNIQLHEAKD